MRDRSKLVGITAHQVQPNLSHPLPETPAKPELGERITEFPYKKAKKNKVLPPADWVGRASIDLIDPSAPFSLFVWYQGSEEKQADDVVVCDITIDSRKSTGWILKAGRNNGILITDLKFQKVIQATFWRVMKVELEYVQDEGLKAIAILQLHRRVEPLRKLRNKNPQLSTVMSSPLVKKIIKFSDLELSSERDIPPARRRKRRILQSLASVIEHEDSVTSFMDIDQENDFDYDLPKTDKQVGTEVFAAQEDQIDSATNFGGGGVTNFGVMPKLMHRKRVPFILNKGTISVRLRVTIDSRSSTDSVRDMLNRCTGESINFAFLYWIDESGNSYDWLNLKNICEVVGFILNT